jgi:glutamyl/glutaminyl-tRNA synthetase
MQVRFDDTNPTKEKDEYVENIIKDMQTLGLQYKTITYTSDYFPQVTKHVTVLSHLCLRCFCTIQGAVHSSSCVALCWIWVNS